VEERRLSGTVDNRQDWLRCRAWFRRSTAQVHRRATEDWTTVKELGELPRYSHTCTDRLIDSAATVPVPRTYLTHLRHTQRQLESTQRVQTSPGGHLEFCWKSYFVFHSKITYGSPISIGMHNLVKLSQAVNFWKIKVKIAVVNMSVMIAWPWFEIASQTTGSYKHIHYSYFDLDLSKVNSLG